MGSALSYLLAKRFKNQVLVLVKSPSKLVMVIVLALIVVMGILTGGSGSQEQAHRDIRELSAGVFALFAIVFAVIANNGFESGASMFRMQDVNLLFPSPVSPQKVLFYGLFQQLGTSMLIGLFLLFQYSWLHNVYGIEFSGIILLFLTYGLTVFLAQLTAMTIYSFTNSDENKKRKGKFIFYGIIVIYAAGLIVYLLGDRAAFVERLTGALNGLAFRLFPVAGWAADIANGAILSDIPALVLGASLCTAFIAGITVLIAKTNPDYYEDVLQSTEIAYNAAELKKQGRLGEAVPRKVKTGKTGIGRGFGANVFYYKQLLENRRSKVILLNPQMLIMVAVIIFFSFFMKDAGLAPIFAFATYMQIFSILFGRLNRELLKPFVYLVPESPFKKLIACIRESFLGIAVEAVLVFVPVSFILGLTPLETLLSIVARFSFGLLFVSGNTLVGRMFGFLTSKALSMMAFIITMIVLAIPGVIASFTFTAGAAPENQSVIMLLSLTALNIPVALLALFASRNMLEYTELNS